MGKTEDSPGPLPEKQKALKREKRKEKTRKKKNKKTVVRKFLVHPPSCLA